MECIYCNPTLQGKKSDVRIQHRHCSDKPLKDNVIREYVIHT